MWPTVSKAVGTTTPSGRTALNISSFGENFGDKGTKIIGELNKKKTCLPMTIIQFKLILHKGKALLSNNLKNFLRQIL